MNGAKVIAMINMLATLTPNVDPGEVDFVCPDESGEMAALTVRGISDKFPDDVVRFAENLGFSYYPYDPDEGDEWWNFTRVQFSLV